MPSQRLSEPINLSSRRVLVTGGTGFLGRTLLDYVEESGGVHGPGVEVSVLTRDPDAFLRRFPCYARLGWLRLLAGDVRQPHLPVGEFTDIIHAAADTHGHEQPLSWIRQIVDGTAAMLEYARLQGVERFLYVSSGAVYGPQPVDTAALAEDHPGAPPTELMSSVYGQAKRLAEQLCTVYHREHRLQTVTARCFAIVGEHVPLSGPYAMGNFLRDALAGNPISVTGDGTAVRTYLYGRDTAHWMMALLLRGEPGEAYNVGSDEEASIAEAARLVASIVRPGLPVTISTTPDAGNGRNRYVPDIAKARRLGLRVETSLAPAIRLTVDRIAAAAASAAPSGSPAAARA